MCLPRSKPNASANDSKEEVTPEVSTGERDPQLLQERILFGGLTALFSLLSVIFPFLFYIAPVPLGVLTYRQGMRTGILVAFVAAAVTGLFLDPLLLVSVMLLLSLGLAIGGGMREGLKPMQVLLVGSVVALIIHGTLLFTLQNFLDSDSLSEIFGQFQELMGEEFEVFIEATRLLIPASLVISSVGLAFLNMWGIHRVLAGRGEKTMWFAPFRTWRLPAVVGWLFLGTLVLAFLPLPNALFSVLINLVSLLGYAFFVTGLSVGVFYTRRWRIQPGFLFLFILLLLFVPLGLGIVGMLASLLGLIDSILNLRRDKKA